MLTTIISSLREYLRANTAHPSLNYAASTHFLVAQSVPMLNIKIHSLPSPLSFSAFIDSDGNIIARGSQDMKRVGLQYIEAIRRLKEKGFTPNRTIHLSFVPDEYIRSHDGAGIFSKPEKFKGLRVGVVLDEGLPSLNEDYRVFYAERILFHHPKPFGFSPIANTPFLLHYHHEFSNEADYIKGIEIYELITKEFTIYKEAAKDEESRPEL